MKLYKAKDLAKILGVHPKTVYRRGITGEIGRIKVGKAVRFYLLTMEDGK